MVLYAGGDTRNPQEVPVNSGKNGGSQEHFAASLPISVNVPFAAL